VSLHEPTTMTLDRGRSAGVPHVDRLSLGRQTITRAGILPFRRDELPRDVQNELDPRDPKQIYHLLKTPNLLRKTARSFRKVPVLRRHHLGSVDPTQVIGRVGDDVRLDGLDLRASVVVTAADAIDAIQTRALRALSAGFWFFADMAPGLFEGAAYDGIMTVIGGHHVALVPEGRCGTATEIFIRELREEQNR
jgi:uncharacterized protein